MLSYRETTLTRGRFCCSRHFSRRDVSLRRRKKKKKKKSLYVLLGRHYTVVVNKVIRLLADTSDIGLSARWRLWPHNSGNLFIYTHQSMFTTNTSCLLVLVNHFNITSSSDLYGKPGFIYPRPTSVFESGTLWHLLPTSILE